jgi:hypothetical protein
VPLVQQPIQLWVAAGETTWYGEACGGGRRVLPTVIPWRASVAEAVVTRGKVSVGGREVAGLRDVLNPGESLPDDGAPTA